MTAPASQPLFRVAILGDGLDAAMTAAVLASALPSQLYSIVVIPAGNEVTGFGPIETSLPSIRNFHARLGIAENDALDAAVGCFSLGAAYSGWSGIGSAYFAPFSDIGSTLEGVAFHQLAQRLRAAGQRVRFADYSVGAMLAQSGRFGHPLDDPRSPLSTYSYGLHLDRQGYSNLLFEVAETAGAVRARRFNSAERNDDGSIAALDCTNGRIEADLFIDASGPAAALARKCSEFTSWSKWLPWDWAVELECSSDVPPAPYALASAERFGWRRTVPGAGRLGECLVYSSSELGAEQARIRIVEDALGRPIAEPRLTQIQSGRLLEPWRANCIAVGGAAATLEPTASTSLHLLQAQLERLVELFPSAAETDILRREYNRLTAQELDRTRDFVLLRYKLNGRRGEPLWDELRAMTVPDELQHKIREYRRRGRVPLFDGDIFDEIEWAALFDEHGVRPERYDVLAETVPIERLKVQFARMRKVMVEAVRGVPPHSKYLAELQRSAAA